MVVNWPIRFFRKALLGWLGCPHRETVLLEPGAALELPKCKHQQGVLQVVKRAFRVCRGCGRMA